MKTCPKCTKPKLLDEFHPSKRMINGSWCRECSRVYGKKYDRERVTTPEGQQKEVDRGRAYRATHRAVIRQKQRAFLDWLQALKFGSCKDCRETFPTWCMDWDHVRGEKFYNVARMVRLKRELVLAEIAKCDLVCARCHRIRSCRQVGSPKGSRAVFKAAVDALKAKPCSDCGDVFPPEAMDFDHVRGLKTSNIAAMTTCTWGRVLEEIGKCDLVCANCHRTRTHDRLQKEAA